ncbi:hypothetical protein CCHR01_04107 [Colletotrichum chrysophilum]|uniref:Uncharacterized protein n=1 Tax=Colletotrichum chrysophilum TaxID=1836956 RepID=A0AAD9ARN2_9PEZI|nr:hypothetical protein CCHR01_04107 [Colletotrichum chrysophilum]
MNEASHPAWGDHFFGCCYGCSVPQGDADLTSSLLHSSTHNSEHFSNGINSTPGIRPLDINHNDVNMYGFPTDRQRASSGHDPRAINFNSSIDGSLTSQLPPISQVNLASSASGEYMSRYSQTASSLQREGDQAFNSQLWETQIPIDPALQYREESLITSWHSIPSPFTIDIQTANSASRSNDSLHSFDTFEAGYINAVNQNGIADGSFEDDSDSSVESARPQTMNRSTSSVLGDHTCPVCKAFTGGVKRLRHVSPTTRSEIPKR